MTPSVEGGPAPVPPSGVSRRTVVVSALWTSAMALVSVPVSAVTTIFLARLLEADAFGRFALYGFLFTTLPGIAELGIGTTIIRRGALAAGSGDEPGLLAAVRAGTTWSLLQLPWSVGLAFLLLPSTTAALLYSAAATASLCALGPSHYLVMTSNLKRASQVRLLVLLLNAGATLATAALTHRADLTFGMSSLSSAVLTFAQVLGVPQEHRRKVFRPGRLSLTRADLGFGLGTLLNGQLTNFVFSRSEVLFFRPTQGVDRGRFAAAQTLAARSTLLVDALLGNVSTALTSAAGRSGTQLRASLELVCEAVSLLLLFVAPMVLAAIAVLAEPLLGDDYSGIAAAGCLLAAISLLQTAASPLLSLRFANGSVRPLLVAGSSGALVNAGAAAALVPADGFRGAVAANALGTATYLAVTVWQFRGDDLEWRSLAVRHMRRMSLLVLLACVPAAVLLVLDERLEVLLAAPLALLCSFLLTRLPALPPDRDAVGTILVAVLREKRAHAVQQSAAFRCVFPEQSPSAGRTRS